VVPDEILNACWVHDFLYVVEFDFPAQPLASVGAFLASSGPVEILEKAIDPVVAEHADTSTTSLH